MGFSFGSQYNSRYWQLRKLRSSLKLLETEINYSLNPLPQALIKVGTRVSQPVNVLYQYSAQLMEKDMGAPIDEIWEKALIKLAEVSSLKKTELDILLDFGQGLGVSDKEEQLKNLQLAQEQLRIVEANADALRQKNERMYKTLGVLAGLALALILI